MKVRFGVCVLRGGGGGGVVEPALLSAVVYH